MSNFFKQIKKYIIHTTELNINLRFLIDSGDLKS